MQRPLTEPPTIQPRNNRATLSGDVIGGVTTFFTMSYIVVVNPGILASPGTGMPFSGALTATVLLACSMSFLMGDCVSARSTTGRRFCSPVC